MADLGRKLPKQETEQTSAHTCFTSEAQINSLLYLATEKLMCNMKDLLFTDFKTPLML
jgi:hypothetical protein